MKTVFLFWYALFFSTQKNKIKTNRNNSNHSSNHFGQFKRFKWFKQLKQFKQLKKFETVWNSLEQFETVWNSLRPPPPGGQCTCVPGAILMKSASDKSAFIWPNHSKFSLQKHKKIICKIPKTLQNYNTKIFAVHPLKIASKHKIIIWVGV